MTVYWKKLRETAIIPERKTEYSAGFDLCADLDEPVTIKKGQIKMIKTGLAAEPSDKNVTAFIFARSGLAANNGITLANSVGVVDSDYRGEWKIPLINHGDKDFTVEAGMRIAQAVFIRTEFPKTAETDVLGETERGENGFGSTGIK